MKNIIFLLLSAGILSFCSNDDAEVDTQEFIPEEVSVGIKSGTKIDEIFDFINQYDHNGDKITCLQTVYNMF